MTTEPRFLDLTALPLAVRDDLISQVMRFLVDRGYGIYAPGTPLQHPDTDIRCPHHTPAGQCLDHQGHLGDHQYPQETR